MKIKNFARCFYSIKYYDNYKVIRILFIRIKLKHDGDHEFVPFCPNLVNIGKQTYTGGDIYIESPNTEIGRFCSIGQRCILGHGEHPVHFLSTSPFLYLDKMRYKSEFTKSYNQFLDIRPIKIGNDVWIGEGVFIKNGVNIGDGVIIGARAIITKDIPPYAIVVGNPGRIIKYRFDQETIDTLLELQWWNLPDEIIRKIPFDDLKASITMLKDIRKSA